MSNGVWPEVLIGDCREVLREMAPESVHCVISSPLWDSRIAHSVEPTAFFIDRLKSSNIFVGQAFRFDYPNGSVFVRKLACSDDLRHVRRPLTLLGSKPQDQFSLPRLDAEIRQKQNAGIFRLLVGDRPDVERPPIWLLLFFQSHATAEAFGQKIDGILVYHLDLNGCVKSGGFAVCSIESPFGSLDSDASFSVDQSSAVSDAGFFSHGSPPICSIRY